MHGLVHNRQEVTQQGYYISQHEIEIKVNGCGQTDLNSKW